MKDKLQREWCVWPKNRGMQPTHCDTNHRFDKLIGLIPQSDCLFKTFYYNIDLIQRNELRDCITNELEGLVTWKQCDSYLWINKVDNTWVVSVWLWDAEQIEFDQPLTHKLPAMAYYFSRCKQDSGLLIYAEEKVDSTKQLWALKWNKNQVVEQFYPLSSPLYYRNVKQELQNPGLVIFSNVLSTDSILNGVKVSDFQPRAKSSMLNLGKCSTQFDLDNPWLYWKQMLLGVGVVLFYMSLDAGLLTYQNRNLQLLIDDKQQVALPLQNQLVRRQEYQHFLHSYYRARARQMAPAKILEVLTNKLAKDIVITRLAYQADSLVLEGTIVDSNDLLTTLAGLSQVDAAKLLGDIVPTLDGRQEFKAQLVLKDAYQWTK